MAMELEKNKVNLGAMYRILIIFFLNPFICIEKSIFVKIK